MVPTSEMQPSSSLQVLALEIHMLDYITFSLFALTIFEHMINLSKEVSYIWGRKLTPFALFLLALRYSTIAYIILCIACLFTTTKETCTLIFRSAETLRMLLLVGFCAGSTLRVYTLSNKRWVILISALLGMVPAVNSLILLILPAPGTKFVLENGYVRHLRTSPGAQNRVAFMVVISRLSAILTDIVVLVVTLKKTLPSYRRARSVNIKLPIITALVIDGKLYFLAAITANLLELTLSIALPHVFTTPFICVLTSVLFSRFFLDLRDASSRATMNWTTASSFDLSAAVPEAHDSPQFVDQAGHWSIALTAGTELIV